MNIIYRVMAVLLSANESYPVLQPTVGHRILNFRCNKQSFLLSYNLNRVIVNRVPNLTNLYHYCHCYTYRVLLAFFILLCFDQHFHIYDNYTKPFLLL